MVVFGEKVELYSWDSHGHWYYVMFSGKWTRHQNLECWVVVVFSQELCDLEQVT